MNDTIAVILSTTLVSAVVLAELNLMRLFVNDWREDRRRDAWSRLRAPATGERATSTFSIGRPRRVPVAASLLCGVIPSAVLAQESSTTPPQPAASVVASPARDQLNLERHATLAFQPPDASNDPAPLVISADRPGFSDTTSIAPVGHLQLETGYTFTFRNRDGAETQRHNGPELLARVGLLDDRLELRAATSGYVWSRTDDGTSAGFASSEGLSDISLGFKLKLTDQDGALPRLAFEGITTVGVGSRAISSRRAEPTIKLIWSYDLEKLCGEDWKGLGVFGNFNLAYPTANGDHFLQGAGSIGGTYAVTDKLSLFAEYFVLAPNSKGTDAAHYIDFGGAYLLNNRVQLDARVGFGLNQEADNAFFGVGISFLF